MESRKDGGFGRVNPLNDDRIEGGRPSKFLYKGTKPKSDPWRSDNLDREDDFIKPKSGQRNNKRPSNSPGFDLEDVWSIRKNVQVSSAVKSGAAMKTNNKSFYSRHGNFGGGSEYENLNLSKRQKKDDLPSLSSPTDSKTWSVARSGYSYSDNYGNTGNASVSPLRDEFDDPLNNGTIDMVEIKNKLNMKLQRPGAPQLATREMSGRTKKAHNLHQAHLRSSGLGDFTPGTSGQYNQQTNNNNVKWESDDFL